MKALAVEAGLDSSNMRKYVLKHGFKTHKMRLPDTRSQLTHSLTRKDADRIIAMRKGDGYISGNGRNQTGYGHLYVLLVAPELTDKRIKIGFAVDMAERMAAHRTIAPTLKVIATWSCERSWEGTARDCIIRQDCVAIGGEVYDCEDVDALILRGNQFFSMMLE